MGPTRLKIPGSPVPCFTHQLLLDSYAKININFYLAYLPQTFVTDICLFVCLFFLGGKVSPSLSNCLSLTSRYLVGGIIDNMPP